MGEEDQQKKPKLMNVKARVSVHGLDLVIDAPSRLSDVDSTITSLLGAIESQANRISSVAKRFEQPPPTAKIAETSTLSSKDPHMAIATDLEVDVDELRKAKVFGFKEGKPQILSPKKFASPEKGCLALFYAFEIGLDKSPISLEEGEEAYHMSRYTEPFAGRVLSNLKTGNKINRSRYDSAHEIVLTPSGIEDAREAVKIGLTGVAKPTKKRTQRGR